MFDGSLLCFLRCLRHGNHQLTQLEAAQCHQMVVVLGMEAGIIWPFLAGTGDDQWTAIQLVLGSPFQACPPHPASVGPIDVEEFL